MLFPQRFHAGLADGSITVAFRRQRRPTVRAGGTLQTPAGLLSIDEVALIAEGDITDADARAAGHRDRSAVLASLRAEGDLYRIRFHRAGDDPRLALRQQTELSDDDLARLQAALHRLPWAVRALRLIADHPGTVSTELAPRLGMERHQFKARIRRLKALGLTESLKVGYRLSPRGRALLALLERNGALLEPNEPNERPRAGPSERSAGG